jgi:hypothetical protein
MGSTLLTPSTLVKLSVSKPKKSGDRIRKIYDDEPKAGTGVGKKFNSLKFNF